MSRLSQAKPVTFILTRDRKAAIPFYSDTLGLSLVREDDFAAVYDLAGTTLRLSDVEGWTPGPDPALGWQVADIRATVTELTAAGVVFAIYEGFGQDAAGIWTAPDGRVKVAWFKDPEGNVLSLTES